MPKTIPEIIHFLESRKVIVKNSKSLMSNKKHQHLIIKGKKRNVNYYPTTGTIYCEPVKNKFKPYKLKQEKQEKALERILGLANFGH